MMDLRTIDVADYRLLVGTGQLSEDEVAAWFEAHGLDINDCRAISVNPRTGQVVCDVMKRRDGQFYVENGVIARHDVYITTGPPEWWPA